ncbi:hypothetical protein [Mucilaginibacter terrenus]|uniref:hypothetical protein n=1 Tax=Mucilaginibacter terrenus TaxID=2482727 RepID=UPI001401E6C5|nr:hypothetical protein [Mucilaginibacter terrenus]
MESGVKFVKGQKVLAPEGEGSVIEVNGGEVKVKLSNGEVKSYQGTDLEDDSDAG